MSINCKAMSDIDIQMVQNIVKTVRGLQLCKLSSCICENFSELAAPLYQVVDKHKFRWGLEQEQAFQALKTALVSPPVLALPNRNDPFVLDTDASDLAIGTELLQIQDGKEKPAAYGSFSVATYQHKFLYNEKRAFSSGAIYLAVSTLLLGNPFTFSADDSSLSSLMRFHEPEGQLAR